MNMLAKFNPFTRAEPLDLFNPSFRADTFRDMEDIVCNMQRTPTPWPEQTDEPGKPIDRGLSDERITWPRR